MPLNSFVWHPALYLLSGIQGNGLSEEADSHEEDSQEWRGGQVEGEESGQEDVVSAQSKISNDDRVVRTEGEDIQLESDEKLQQTSEPHQNVEAEQHHRSVDVPSETPKEAPDNLEMVVEGPARGNSPEVTGDFPSQTDKSVTKASFSSSQEKKGSEAIPDLTRQPAEEEEGDGEGPACVLQLSSLASLKLSVSIVLCLQYTYIGNVLCLQYTYIGNVLCLQYTYIGNVLCLQYTYICNVLCLQYTYIAEA